MQPNKKIFLHLITTIEHFHLVVFTFKKFKAFKLIAKDGPISEGRNRSHLVSTFPISVMADKMGNFLQQHLDFNLIQVN